MRLCLALVAGPVLVALSLFSARAAEDDDPAPPEGVQVQARGPVHEGFAEASDSFATPSPVVTKEPPEPIEEAPPEEKPEGDNVAWLPGYWGWDEEEADFLWVSGFWRVVPPGRAWVPGSWQKAKGGFVWVAGYWSEERETAHDTEYLPEPPETLERGASTPPPSDEYTYVPGFWNYTTRYVWRPGYYVKFRPNWVWVPDCHKWTPLGFVHVNGYWDTPLAERGLLFAPVRFTDRVHLRRGFVYRPAFVVQPDFLVGSLFVRKDTRRYHFGNYFEETHRRRYVAWVDHRPVRGVYDVNYNYYRRSFADSRVWERNVRDLYQARYRGDIARPPVTLVQQRKVVNTIVEKKTTNVFVNKTVNITNVQNVSVLAPVRRATAVQVTGLARLAVGRDEEVKVRPRTIRVEKASEAVVKEERRQVERYRAIATERRTLESKAVAKLTDGTKAKEPVRLRVEAPKTAPPPRRIKAPTPPPPPVARPKVEDRDPPRKDGPPRKDREKDPPPPPKDRDKDKTTPKDRDKTPPPVKDKTPPVPPRDKDKTPKDRDKTPPPVKDKTPPVPPVKDKPPTPPPPPKVKEKTPPPPPKVKETPPPTPPKPPAPPPKVVPPVPKGKDAPPPAKDRPMRKD